MTDTPTHNRQWQAVCKTCGKEYDWRDTYVRARTDRENHADVSLIVCATQDCEPVSDPDMTFRTREVNE